MASLEGMFYGFSFTKATLFLGIKILKIASIVIGGYLLGKYAQKQLERVLSNKYADKLVTNIVSKVTFYIILFVVAAITAQEFGINVSSLIATAGVLGVAVGFAAKTSLSNIISGFFLIIEKPFVYNDIIAIGDSKGRVIDINLFAVTLLNKDNVIIRIPHEKVLKSVIVNETAPKNL